MAIADVTRRGYWWLMVAAATCYSTFLLELALGFPLSPVHSYLSEYAALGQPTRPIFVAADLASAVLGTVATVIALARGWGSPRLHALLLLAWLFIVADAVLTPMHCAESLAHCTGQDSGLPHVVSSSAVAVLHAVVALLLWKRYPVVSSAYLGISIVVSALALAQLPVGIAQRTQVALECVVIVLAARTTSAHTHGHNRAGPAQD